MPTLSGSGKARLQARAGIARFGASWFNAFTPNVVVTINGSPVQSSVLQSSLLVMLALNDEGNRASFTMKPGTAPVSSSRMRATSVITKGM